MALFSRRKKYFVERALQLRFARFVLVFMFLSCAITACAVFYSTFMILSEKLVGIYPQGRLIEIFRSVYFAFGLVLVLVAPVIFYVAVVFSHRIAGPLPKIYQTLRNIGNGQWDERLVLRKHDELKELADVINEMAAKLKQRENKP